MANKPESQTLVDEKLALSLFLDSLLCESAVQSKQETPVATEPTLEVSTSAPSPQVAAPVLVETQVAPAQTEIETDAAQTTLPQWAHAPFQVLLFKVAGLTLAVPLESLSGVVEWPPSLVAMPGHADFYLGILQYLEQRIPVVDTAKLVFPADKQPQLAGRDTSEASKRIVLIDDGNWGLACDEVAEVVTLSADQVRWRSEHTQRRWLLGTVVEHMCALLDTDAFAQRLKSGHD